MKRKTFIYGLAALLLSSITFAGYASKPKDITGEIQKLNDKFSQIFVSGDAHALSMLYTKDAKLFPVNADVIQGRETIEKAMAPMMSMGIKKYILKTVEAKSCGNLAYEEGRYEAYMEGNRLIDQGKYLVIWKKVDGQWKIFRDIYNTSVPLPQPESKE